MRIISIMVCIGQGVIIWTQINLGIQFSELITSDLVTDTNEIRGGGERVPDQNLRSSNIRDWSFDLHRTSEMRGVGVVR